MLMLKELPNELPNEPSESLTQMTEQEFEVFKQFVYEHFGIHLSDEKRLMVSVRLQKAARRLKLASIREFLQHLHSNQTADVVRELTNHITTNHTFFWRESDHFEVFQQHVLPEIAQKLRAHRDFDLRVWSAGCSSGEEAYILVMLMMEVLGADYAQWKAGVLATDISEQALSTARRGTYSTERIAPLPPQLKHKYFQQSGQHGEWEVIARVKNEVTFRNLNLMNERFPFKKPFHVVFCRNVMIYFDQPTREALVRRLYDALIPGGYLFIGHSETLGRSQTLFRYMQPAVYQKVVSRTLY